MLPRPDRRCTYDREHPPARGSSQKQRVSQCSEFSRLWVSDGSRLEFIKDQHGRVTANCAGSRPEEDAPAGIVLLQRNADDNPDQPGCNLEEIKAMFDETQPGSAAEHQLEQVAAAEVNYLNAVPRMEAAKTAEIERHVMERLAHLADTGECSQGV